MRVGLLSADGALIVTTSDASGAWADGVSVMVDHQVRCTSTPCTVDGLSPGTHFVNAVARGFPQIAARAVSIEPHQLAAQHLTLYGPERSGLRVSAIGGNDLRVVIDGHDMGAPPVSVEDMTPGRHLLRVQGPEPFYEAYERFVTLAPGQLESVGPVRLRVLQGRLTLRGGPDVQGARVAVDGRVVPYLPATLDLSAEEPHEVTAERPGHGSFRHQVRFDRAAQRSVEIILSPREAR